MCFSLSGTETSVGVFLILKQFGDIEDCQMEDSSQNAIITYRTRSEAELVRRSLYLSLSHTHTHTHSDIHTQLSTHR